MVSGAGRCAAIAGAMALVLVALGGVACSSPPTLQAPGGRCFQVSDCQMGLVCIKQGDGTSVCSGDTSTLVMTETDAGVMGLVLADASPDGTVSTPGDDDAGDPAANQE